MNLQSFKVTKLHGTMPDYKLKFTNNKLILIGENGSGKTTLMKMLFYALSAQWSKLFLYKFESIELIINEQIFNIHRKDIESILLTPKNFRRLHPAIRREILDGNLDIEKLKEVCVRYDIPFEFIIREFEDETSDSINKKNKGIRTTLNSIKSILSDIHILYLPTYRRIEQDLKAVLGDIIDYDSIERRDEYIQDSDKNYTELVEFGMDDVDKVIKRTSSKLRRFFGTSLNSLSLSYLSEIISERYKTIDNSYLSEIDETTIFNVVNRVDETILSKENKTLLSSKILGFKNSENIDTATDQVACHYFEKLYQAHRDLKEQERPIREFANICGKYFKNKQVNWDSTNFEFSITPEYSSDYIDLAQLSSGEKQIAALFSKILLENKNCFIIIDEPELSLSVKWQRQFLEDICKSEYCKGLFAVTHSPFIFDNGLDAYAHGLDEFRNIE